MDTTVYTEELKATYTIMQQINVIKKCVKDLNTIVVDGNLNQRVENIDTIVNSIQNNIVVLEQSIDSLNTLTTSHTNNITGIQTVLTETRGLVDSLGQTVNTIQQDLQHNITLTGELITRLTTCENNIQQLTTSLTSLEQRVVALENSTPQTLPTAYTVETMTHTTGDSYSHTPLVPLHFYQIIVYIEDEEEAYCTPIFWYNADGSAQAYYDYKDDFITVQVRNSMISTSDHKARSVIKLTTGSSTITWVKLLDFTLFSALAPTT
jgi:exonuclease VII small subunit